VLSPLALGERFVWDVRLTYLCTSARAQKNMLQTLFLIVGILLIFLLIGGYFLARYFLPYAILQPGNKTGDQTPGNYDLPYEHFELQPTNSIKLDAFYVPAVGKAKANFIMLHGVGSCKEVYLNSVAELAKIGFNVLLWDQRAHGKSGGKYLTYGYFEKGDVSLAIDWLENKTTGLPTGIYGNSMGGAVAIQSLAHDARLKFGLIESTFIDLRTVSNSYGRRMSGLSLPFWLTDYVLTRAGKIASFEPFSIRPIDAATKVTQPILHIHGDADANINVAHAHALFAAYASGDKQLYIVENGDHADLWEKGGEGYREAWFGFLGRMPEGRNE
jgi:pimeloyl-ACP methyl ester carboxylesterase